MKNLMKRAWEIYRTLTGNHIAKLSRALKMAWAEVKTAVKEAFSGFAKVAKMDNPYSDSSYLTFKLWEKNGYKRVYINDYKRRTLGYIDVNTKAVVIEDNQGNSDAEVNTAVNSFLNTYAF